MFENENDIELKGIVGIVSTALTWASAACIFTLTALVFVSVFFRYAMSSPLLMAEDLMAILLGLTIFSAFPYVTIKRQHIQVDLLAKLFSSMPVVDRVRGLIIDLLVLFGISFLALRLYDQATKFYARDTITETMQWPLWPVIASFVALLAVSAILFAFCIIADLRTPLSKKDTHND